MLTRFRLGEFDEREDGSVPWKVDESLIDSPMHRSLAREAASASVVLATNRCDMTTRKCSLPVVADGVLAGKTIAVLGPFANCSDAISGGWSKTNCYLHSYVL
jgi:beta-glucosidase-like glycosyl hydrolase